MNTDQLAKAFGKVAWSYIFLYMDFNFLVVNVLPDWVGYLLILPALPALAERVPAVMLLKPLGVFLAVWHGLNWVLGSFGGAIEIYVLDVLEAALALYFFFQLLTNLAEIPRQLDFPEEKKLLQLRTVQAVVITLTALTIPWDSSQVLTMALAVVHLVVVLWVCGLLFALKKKLEMTSESEDEEMEHL